MGTRVFQLAELGRVGAVFLIGIILSRRFGNSPEVAQYETLITLASGLSFAPLWALIGYFNSAFPSADGLSQKRILGNIALLCGAVGVFSGAVAFAVGFGLKGFAPIEIIFYALFAFGQTAATPLEYLLLARGRYWTLLTSAAVWYGGQTAIALLAAFFNWPMVLCYAAWVLLAAARFVFWAVILKTENAAVFDFSRLRTPLRQMAPLAGAALVTGSSVYIDAYLVQLFTDAQTFVLFRYAARELPLTLVLANALSARTVQRIAAANGHFDEPLTELRRETLRLSWIAFPFTIGLMIAAPYLFGRLYGETFAPAAAVFQIILLLAVPRMLFPQSILLGLRRNRTLFKVSVVELAIHVGLALALLPLFGLTGLAWAMVAAYLFEKIALLYFVEKQGITWQRYLPAAAIAAWTLVLVIFWLIFG